MQINSISFTGSETKSKKMPAAAKGAIAGSALAVGTLYVLGPIHNAIKYSRIAPRPGAFLRELKFNYKSLFRNKYSVMALGIIALGAAAIGAAVGALGGASASLAHKIISEKAAKNNNNENKA